MIQCSVTVKGIEQTHMGLLQLSGNVVRKCVRNALKAGAQVYRRELLATLTGTSATIAKLATAIRIWPAKRSVKRIAYHVGIKMADLPQREGVKKPIYWLAMWSYGHRIRVSKFARKYAREKGRDIATSKRVEGSGWLANAKENARPMAIQVMNETFARGIAEETAKLGAKKA